MLLDSLSNPIALRNLPESDLKQVADELRSELIRIVSGTGGHLGAGLGVIELTVALHYIFDTPDDKLIWDVGHQAYPHKILTGRREQMASLRQRGGLSGFCKIEESPYDPFGAGHSSTSISAGLGMAVARDLKSSVASDQPSAVSGQQSALKGGQEADSVMNPQSGASLEGQEDPIRTQKNNPHYDVISVIGDGAMSAGMAYEAMNNAGHLGSRMIVVLNDNDMSIGTPTGAMSAYLSRIVSSSKYHNIRDLGKMLTRKFPQPMARIAKKVEQYARAMVNGGNLFEEMGFYYVGPIDGHNLDHLLPVLKNIKAQKDSGPILLHVVTQKGKGFESEDSCAEKFHAVKKFDLTTRRQAKSTPAAPSYTSVFTQQLIEEAKNDEAIVAIHAAMPSGTGLNKFEAKFPDRIFDVGIAEQHAVTFAAGLATEGIKPFCAIYSTFLQRAYDQVVHDVCIQNLPVRFAIDRAGLVGADGPTHAGSFDIGYLSSLPNMVLMAPSDEVELMHAVHTAAQYDKGPIAFRYPRGEGTGAALPEAAEKLEIGKGQIVRQGDHIAILSLGTLLQNATQAVNALQQEGKKVTLADARFAKPIDTALLERLLKEHAFVITLEEGATGGFGSHCAQAVSDNNWFAAKGYGQLVSMTLPDRFQSHGTQEEMLAEAGLDPKSIKLKVESLWPQSS